MLKIGLWGYGKMGKAIDALAEQNDVLVVWRITRENAAHLTDELLRKADVVIEFTQPESAYGHIIRCIDAGVPVVSGTTGRQERIEEAKLYCIRREGALLWASNFSVGVNLFFALNRYLAALTAGRPEYRAALTEIHHIHKLDAPSGTAITLAEGILEQHPEYTSWSSTTDETTPERLPVTSLREGAVPGTHIVEWKCGIDEIRIEHRAHSREGFALGAIMAAKWIYGKTGVYSMRDIVG